LVLLTLTENIWVIFPVALISALGVYTLLVMIYTIAIVMLMKKDNAYSKLSEMKLPLLIGALLALAQIALFDLARYLWTGTWLGFNL